MKELDLCKFYLVEEVRMNFRDASWIEKMLEKTIYKPEEISEYFI